MSTSRAPLPANFTEWDKPASSQKRAPLPANFSGWDDPASSAPQPAYVPAPGNSISAAPSPSWLDRLRGTVANSAIGHSLETGLPKVADALNLHPTETVNSPTYQSDKEQFIAPQYLMPGSPKGFVGNVTKGALTGVGQLTNKKSIATTAGIAATGGLVAPLAAGTGALATAGRLGAQGLKYGMAASGTKGVYDDAKNAFGLYSQGKTAEAEQALGAALPNAAMTLPALGKPLQHLGEGMQGAGEGLINTVVGARKKDFARGANPGAGYFQAGFGPSASMGSIADKANVAFSDTGQHIGELYDAATKRGVLISPDRYAQAVRNPLSQAEALATGPGGTGLTPQMESYKSSFSPSINTAQQGGGITPNDLFSVKHSVAKNTTWNDPTQFNLNKVRQMTVGGLGGALTEAVPEAAALNSKYQNLASLKDVAGMRSQTGQQPLTNIGGKLLSAAGAGGIGSMSHSPWIAAGSALAGLAADSVPVKTTAASGLFYGGKGLAKVGGTLGDLFSPKFTSPPERLAMEGITANTLESNANSKSNNNPNQGTPPSGLYGTTAVTPEIVNPSQMSRSRMGVGTDGRGGTLVRPLGLLNAPSQPVPEAVPYSFTAKPPSAVPAANPASRSPLVPNSLYKDLFSSGTEAEKAAALRQARLGSLGGTVPGAAFRPPPPVIEGLYGKKKKK